MMVLCPCYVTPLACNKNVVNSQNCFIPPLSDGGYSLFLKSRLVGLFQPLRIILAAVIIPHVTRANLLFVMFVIFVP